MFPDVITTDKWQTGIRTITMAEYNAIDAVRQSNLKQLEKSALHYRHAVEQERTDALACDDEDDETDATIVGDAAHCAVLEPHAFMDRYVVFPGKVRRGKEWDAFRAELNGRTCLLQRQFEKAARIGDRVRKHPRVAELLRYGKPEQTITWVDAATGLRCKARADWLGPSLVGLKTSRSILARDVGNSCIRYGYTLQWAFYRAGYRAATGDDAPMREIFVESSEPRDVCVYRVTEDALAHGEHLRETWMAQLAHHIETDTWPGMGQFGERDIELPRWTQQTDDEEEPTFNGKRIA